MVGIVLICHTFQSKAILPSRGEFLAATLAGFSRWISPGLPVAVIAPRRQGRETTTLGTVKILVLGPGGREHALVRTLLADPDVTQVDAAPGNAGIAAEVPVHQIDANDPEEVVALAQRLGSDLVVIGPEAPLAAGVSDALRAVHIPVFGPSAAAAQLESSKVFAKQVMTVAGVPTAASVHAKTAEQVRAACVEFGAPYVIKDDGLAAGKGVVVTEDLAAALAHAESCFASGSTVVVEEFLDGPEVSVFVIADGTPDGAVALSPAQDFKRIHDDDQGPNTGGMGAYTPLDWLPENFTEQVLDQVARPVLAEMDQRGTPFLGVLYCGLAVTTRGIRVIEFNARFGDPETQPVLSRLTTPLGQLLLAAARSELAERPELTPRFTDSSAVAVVLASPGYPGTTRTGAVMTGIADAEALEKVAVFHAGTAANDSGEYLSAGGRVLAVVGQGDTLAQARQRAYQGLELIHLEDGQYRTDIARRAVAGEIQLP